MVTDLSLHLWRTDNFHHTSIFVIRGIFNQLNRHLSSWTFGEKKGKRIGCCKDRDKIETFLSMLLKANAQIT